jgi:hypothetical protein
MIEPDFTALLNHFVQHNVDTHVSDRKIENRRHYEQGRSDAEASQALNVAPDSFRSTSVVPAAGWGSERPTVQVNDHGRPWMSGPS